MTTLNLWVALAKRRDNSPRHWILIAAEPNSERGTYYHVTGGPIKHKEYALEISSGKRLNSNGNGEIYYVSQMDEKDRNKLQSSTKKVEPKFCQRCVVYVLADLDRNRIVPSGTYDTWYSQMEHDPYSNVGAPY